MEVEVNDYKYFRAKKKETIKKLKAIVNEMEKKLSNECNSKIKLIFIEPELELGKTVLKGEV